MDMTMNYIALLKDNSVELNFDKTGRCNKWNTKLYDGDRVTAKYDQNERGGNSEQLSLVYNLLDELPRSAFENEIQLLIAHDYWKYPYNTRFDMAVYLMNSFVNKLSSVLIAPKLAVCGQFLAINVDENGILEKDLGAHSFKCSEIGIHPRYDERYEFEGMNKMTELWRSSKRSELPMEFKFKYSRAKYQWNGVVVPPAAVPSHTGKVDVLERLLNGKLFPDCYIIAANNAKISCHRGVLAAHSDVLHTMFSSGLLEAQTQKIEMTDVSEQGVNTFVNYLYQNKINPNEIGEEVALELLQMSHKYNIPNLEGIMLNLLHGKSGNWFSVGGALTIYLFTEKIEGCKLLSQRMLDILKQNNPQYRSTLAHQALLEQNSKAAAELEIMIKGMAN